MYLACKLYYAALADLRFADLTSLEIPKGRAPSHRPNKREAHTHTHSLSLYIYIYMFI